MNVIDFKMLKVALVTMLLHESFGLGSKRFKHETK